MVPRRRGSSYGRYQHSYQHSYQDLLAAYDELLPSAGDRVTILHLGAGLDEELGAVYLALAGSTVPLSEEDREALALLAALRTGGDLHPARSFRNGR